MKKLILLFITFLSFFGITQTFAYESFSEFQITTNAGTEGPYTSSCIPNTSYTPINYSGAYNLVVGGGGCFRFETSFMYGSGSYSALNFEILNIPSGFHNTSSGTIGLQYNGSNNQFLSSITGSTFLVDFTDYYGQTFSTFSYFNARRIQFNVDNNISCGIYEIPMKFQAVRLTTGDYQTFYNRIKINVNSNCVDNTSQTGTGQTFDTSNFVNLIYLDSEGRYWFNKEYSLWQEFFFYSIVLLIVGIYLFFKFIRFILDLFFN